MHTVFCLKKPEGKRPLERHGHRWEDNIRMVLKEVWSAVVVWIHLASGYLSMNQQT
jgi:hypothetical protein